jgi:hypothetical protein
MPPRGSNKLMPGTRVPVGIIGKREVGDTSGEPEDDVEIETDRGMPRQVHRRVRGVDAGAWTQAAMGARLSADMAGSVDRFSNRTILYVAKSGPSVQVHMFFAHPDPTNA